MCTLNLCTFFFLILELQYQLVFLAGHSTLNLSILGFVNNWWGVDITVTCDIIVKMMFREHEIVLAALGKYTQDSDFSQPCIRKLQKYDTCKLPQMWIVLSMISSKGYLHCMLISCRSKCYLVDFKEFLLCEAHT